MENVNKEKLKLIGVALALLVGVLLLYREVHFWMTYNAVKSNLINVNHAMTNFENDFLQRADNFKRRTKEFDKEFAKREANFNSHFDKFKNTQDVTEKINEDISANEQIPALIEEKLIELLFKEPYKPLGNDDPRERLESLQKKIIEIRKLLAKKHELKPNAKLLETEGTLKGFFESTNLEGKKYQNPELKIQLPENVPVDGVVDNYTENKSETKVL